MAGGAMKMMVLLLALAPAFAFSAALECGEPGSAGLFGNLVVMDIAQRNGEKTADALCPLVPKYCEPRARVKYGVEQVFALVRKYSGRISSPGCAVLRDECRKRCENSREYEDDTCRVECERVELGEGA